MVDGIVQTIDENRTEAGQAAIKAAEEKRKKEFEDSIKPGLEYGKFVSPAFDKAIKNNPTGRMVKAFCQKTFAISFG